jgi:hypothetical protein
MSDKRRTFHTPTLNNSSSDYINNLRAKVKFSGTSDLANNVVLQNNVFPLRKPNGRLKPYQGTYGFSRVASNPCCLNTSRSYRDLLDITKGKYLLTPPNPVGQNITINMIEPSQLYNGTYFDYSYNGINTNILYHAYDASLNVIIFNELTTADQWIHVDPSYQIFYDGEACLKDTPFFKNISLNQNPQAKKNIDRLLNLNLLNGFSYPSKFSLSYQPQDCLNANNILQPSPSMPPPL